MKKLLFAGLLLGFIQLAKAQDTIPVPEFDNKPMYYNKETNSLGQLERQTAEVKIKNKVVVVETYYYYKNKTSNFRIKGNQQSTQFLYKTASNSEIDLYLTLYKFSINESKNVRELKIASGSVAGSKSFDNKITYDYKKVSNGLYLISVEGLTPGEYGFAMSTTTYLFGID